jgi:hypothetical protein
MTKELKTLYNECRANSCIEHATGIMEDEKAPENLSKKISTISLSGVDKKVTIWTFVIPFCFSQNRQDDYSQSFNCVPKESKLANRMGDIIVFQYVISCVLR